MIVKNPIQSESSTDDLTTRYVRALRQGGAVQAVRERLSLLTAELINARNVHWVSLHESEESDAPDTRRFEFNGCADDEEAVAVVRQACEQPNPVIRPSDSVEGATAIGIPVGENGVLFCRLVARANTLSSFIAILKMAAGYFVLAEERQRQGELQHVASHSQAAITLIANLLNADSRKQAFDAYCEQLRAGCHVPVAMLFQVKSRRFPRLLATSGTGEEPLGSEAKRLASQYAAESALAATASENPPDPQTRLRSKTEESLSKQCGAGRAMSVTVRDQRNSVDYVIILVGDSLAPSAEAPIRQIIQATGPALIQRGSGRAGTKRRIWSAGTRQLFVVVTTVATIVFAMMLQVPYHVRSPLTLAPTQHRHLAAPFDGVLLGADVKSGDVVKQGQVLGRLDDAPLRLELSRKSTELIRVQKQLEIHLARGEISESQLAQLRVKELTASTDLLKQRIEQAEIVTPISGVILSQDLDDATDSPVSQGQPLFEVAPLDQLRAEIEVPDYESNHVQNGLGVSVWINDGSSRRIDGVLSRIAPSTTVRRQQNVVLCELMIENGDQTLRPGMDGSASIDVGKASLGWVLFHRLWDSLRVYIGA